MSEKYQKPKDIYLCYHEDKVLLFQGLSLKKVEKLGRACQYLLQY